MSNPFLFLASCLGERFICFFHVKRKKSDIFFVAFAFDYLLLLPSLLLCLLRSSSCFRPPALSSWLNPVVPPPPLPLSPQLLMHLLHLPGQPNRLPLSYQIYRTTLYCRSYPSFTRQLPWLLLLPFTGNPDALPIGITSFTDPPVDLYLIKCGANHSNDIILTSLEIPSPRIS